MTCKTSKLILKLMTLYSLSIRNGLEDIFGIVFADVIVLGCSAISVPVDSASNVYLRNIRCLGKRIF